MPQQPCGAGWLAGWVGVRLTWRSRRMSMNLACRLLWEMTSRTVVSAWFWAPVSAST